MKQRRTWLRLLPVGAMLLILLLFGAVLREVSFQDILAFTPKNYWLAALTLLALYALKSVSVVFPLLALYVSAGALFPLPGALLVNLLGILVCILLPYGIGRFSGREAVEYIAAKHPKAEELVEFSGQRGFFLSYLLRVVSMFPGDLVSMLLGAVGVRFRAYAVGSMLGLLPVMVVATMAGRNLEDPFSAKFLVPMALLIALSLSSTLAYRHWKKKQEGESRPAHNP